MKPEASLNTGALISIKKKVIKMEISEKLLKWIANGERGLSSETIVAKLAGIDLTQGRGSEPYDPSDFRRCLFLLEAVPELNPEMWRMKKVSEYWRLLIENWDELEKMYHEEKHNGTAPKLYAKMVKLREDALDLSRPA